GTGVGRDRGRAGRGGVACVRLRGPAGGGQRAARPCAGQGGGARRAALGDPGGPNVQGTDHGLQVGGGRRGGRRGGGAGGAAGPGTRNRAHHRSLTEAGSSKTAVFEPAGDRSAASADACADVSPGSAFPSGRPGVIRLRTSTGRSGLESKNSCGSSV